MSSSRLVLCRRALAAAIVITACGRDIPAVKRDSARVAEQKTQDSVPTTTFEQRWPADAGALLLVQGENANEAVLLLPDEKDSNAVSMLLTSRKEVVLFNRNGTHFPGELGKPTAATDAECRLWELQPARQNAAWSVGFANADAQALPLDSIEAASPRDSNTLTTEVARLASTVTSISSPSFEGLRFVIHEVRRFPIANGGVALVAHAIRRVNQEANPQEEQTLLIAERDSGSTGAYRLVYADRAHGVEDEVVAPEVLAAVLIGGRPTLIVARDGEDGVAYELLEREANGHWRVRWHSAPTRCG
jgi:hypothetical protein